MTMNGETSERRETEGDDDLAEGCMGRPNPVIIPPQFLGGYDAYVSLT
jgi:hypothetical protein